MSSEQQYPKIYNLRTRRFQRIIGSSVIFMIAFFIQYFFYKQGSLSLLLFIVLQFIVLALCAYLYKVQSKVLKVELHPDYILVPDAGSNDTRITFDSIFCVEENIGQQGSEIRIERKSAMPVSISRMRMDEHDFYNLLEELTNKFPRPKIENEFLKKKLKKAYLIIGVVIIAFMGINLFVRGLTHDFAIRVLVVPLAVAVFSYLLSIVTKRISHFHRTKKEFLNQPQIKRKRLIFNWITGLAFLLCIIGFLLLQSYTKSNFYFSISYIGWGFLSASALLLLTLRQLNASEYVSLEERGLIGFLFLFLGSWSLILASGSLIFKNRDPHTDIIQVGKLKKTELKDGSYCYLPDNSEIMSPPEFCNNSYPWINEKTTVSYKVVKEKMGLDLFHSFRLNQKLTVDLIKYSLNSKMGQYQRCFMHTSSNSAEVVVKFTINAAGIVESPVIEGNIPQNFNSCIRAAIGSLRFPLPEKEGSTKIVQPIKFHRKS